MGTKAFAVVGKPPWVAGGKLMLSERLDIGGGRGFDDAGTDPGVEDIGDPPTLGSGR